MRYRRGVGLGLAIGMVFGLLAAGAWAEQMKDSKDLIAAHHQAAIEAQKKVAFHEEMEKRFVEGKGGGKFDMVGHCKFWADYYRKVAVKEEQAAKELEQKAP